jgi:Spy/CpxP family protein refolding chaperone
MKRFRSLFLAVAVFVTSCLAGAENESNSAETSSIKTTSKIQPDSNLGQVLNTPSATPLGPRDIIAGYESGMTDIGNRMSSDLANISQAVQKKELTREQAEYIIGERYRLAMMQFQLLSALHDVLVEDLAQSSAAATPTTSKSSAAQTSNGMVVVALPFSSFELNPSLAEYLKLDSAQSQAIEQLMSDERRKQEPLMAELKTTREKLLAATQQGHYDKEELRSLATAQARMLTNLITANAQMQTKLYKLLTPEQRAKLDRVKQAGDLSTAEGE